MTRKEVINVGDEFTVDFIKNQTGGKPICRIDGFVCFIHPKERSFVAPCSRWMVKVTEIKENYMIVLPLVKIRMAKENIEDLTAKIASLQTPKKERIAHVKKEFVYKSFAQLRKEKEND